MVFSSIPPQLLDPSNWQHQSNPPFDTSCSIANGLLSVNDSSIQSGTMHAHAHNGGMSCSPRQGSMADRARLANIPVPEAALKCPRCESTNTKFCYFNNYSLSQPRHFCKSCRRYWTRGGALRNVPVGGGCRRNKGNKITRATKSSTQTSSSAGGSSSSADIFGFGQHLPEPRLLSPLRSLTELASDELLLNYGTLNIPPSENGGFSCPPPSSSVPFLNALDQWRLQQEQQCSIFAGLDGSLSFGTSPFDYGFEYDEGSANEHKLLMNSAGNHSGSVKTEKHHEEMSSNNQFSFFPASDLHWNDNCSWIEASSFISPCRSLI